MKPTSLLLAALLSASLACQTIMDPLTGQPSPPAPVVTLAAASATPALPGPSAPAQALSFCPAAPPVAPIYDSLPPNPPHASIGDPYAPELGNRGYDVQRYTLALALDPRLQGILCGSATIEATATEDGLAEFALDFIGLTIQALWVDGVAAEYYRTAEKVVIGLDEPLAAGQNFVILIEYHGRVAQIRSRFVPFVPSIGMFFPSPEMLYVLAEPDGARYWFPANDHPRDKATFQFELLAPPGFTAVANGLLLKEEATEAGTTFHWEHNYPMAPYLATVAVGEFELLETPGGNGPALRSYTLPESRAELAHALEQTAETLPWLEELLGPYPFEAYGYVTVESGGVTLETQTMVALSTFMIDEAVLVHELVHMWFGNSVSLHSWGEMWRNEGFATYFEILWRYRDDPAGFAAEMDALTAFIASQPGLEPLGDLTPANLFGTESYYKGAALIHALRGEVGDAAFFDGLRLYLSRFAGGTASDADFIVVMEETSGRDLAEFFRPWLED